MTRQCINIWFSAWSPPCFAALPLEAGPISPPGVGGAWRTRLPRHKRALDNLAIAFPEMSAPSASAIARAMWRISAARSPSSSTTPDRAGNASTLIPLELSQGRGERAVRRSAAAHRQLGDRLAQAGMRFGVPIAGTYQALTNPLVDRWLLGAAQPMIRAACSQIARRPRALC